MGTDFLGLKVEEDASPPPAETNSTRADRGLQRSMPNELNAQLERRGVSCAAPAATAKGLVTGPPPENPLFFFSPLPTSAEQHYRRDLPPRPAPVPSRGRPMASMSAAGSSPGPASPLTIVYNGTVNTFKLRRDQADAIIKWADSMTSGAGQRMYRPDVALVANGGGQQQPPQAQPLSLDKLRGDLPLARKRSLQRFLEKRKERQ